MNELEFAKRLYSQRHAAPDENAVQPEQEAEPDKGDSQYELERRRLWEQIQREGRKLIRKVGADVPIVGRKP